MRICIFGAGAVGSHFAVRLALSGHDVSCVMRGPHLEAVKAKGLTLRVDDAEFSARLKASDDPAALGPQDLVVSTLKANALGSLVTGLSAARARHPYPSSRHCERSEAISCRLRSHRSRLLRRCSPRNDR